MIAEKSRPAFISNTPVGISIYSITQEAPHYHEGILEIIYCFKGTAQLHSGYEYIEIREGDILSCNSFTIHSLASDQDNLFVSFYFDLRSPIFHKDDLDHIFFVCEKYVLTEEKQNEMQNLKHLLLTLLYFYCFPNERVTSECLFNDLAKNAIQMMLDQFHFFDYINTEPDYSLEAKKRFERIYIYINTHYMEKITIEHLCEKEHLSANYLSKFFKKTSYWGLSKSVNYVRIRRSEFLLLTSDKNISDIAYEVGFSDPKFYYKHFKTWYGHTPLQHKKNYQNMSGNFKDNVYFLPADIRMRLEHYIAYYYATLHIPDFWNVPFTYMRNTPGFGD